MNWFKQLLKPQFPPEVRVVARFEGRLDGETDPIGTAVSGDEQASEATTILPRIVLSTGESLRDRLIREAIPEMNAWMEGSGPDPTPRALLRLLGSSADRGDKIADQGAIVVYWMPGQPPKSVLDGPATLAQILGLPIRLFYAKPGSEQHMVITFEP